MKENKNNYGYITKLKTKKVLPYRLRLQINGKRCIYYFATNDEAVLFRDKNKNLKDKVYRKGDSFHASILTLFREWIKEKELSVSSGSIVSIRNSFKHLTIFNGQWLDQVSKDDCLNLMIKDPSKSLKLAFSSLSEINKFSLEKYNYGFNWNIDGLIKGFKTKSKSHKRIRSFYREDEIALILNHLKGKDLYWFHFFRLGFSLGARIGEICSLKKSNFHKS
jgi:integrase